MPDGQDLQPSSTMQPRSAQLRVTTGASELSEDERGELAVDLQSTWIAAQSARADFDENLKAFSALYEMETAEQDWPWEGAANLVLPIIPAELDAMKSYIASQVFVQRLVVVTAADDDPETAKMAPIVEKFYNAELRRIRADGKTPLDHFKTVLHLGLRDGGAPLDVFYTEREEPKLVISEEPKIVDDNVVIDQETGLPATERVAKPITELVSEVTITPRLLKEWYLVPAEATSIQSALGQPSVVWMTEKQMMEKVKEGVFRAEDVDEVLSWVPSGTSDVASDPNDAYDKDAGGQIGIGLAQGTLTSKFFRNRGPARLIRLFSEQFDMNGDGVAEKNVFWFYPDMPKLLGFEAYEYIAGEWPTFMFAPFPRPNRPYGYSLTERLADLVADANAGRNQRRNYIDLCLMPLLLQREGDTIRDKDRAFYPGAPWTVEDVHNSIAWFTPPQLSSDSWSDEASLERWVSKLSGQNAPALGAQSSGRRTATEMRQQSASQAIRATDVAMDFRAFLRAVIQFWHKLNKQYLGAKNKSITTQAPDGPVTLTPEMLARPFNIEISGLSDPIDASSRRQEMMAAMGTIVKFPEVMNDAEHRYEMLAAFLETFSWLAPMIPALIGTREEAKQRKEQEALAAQMAAQQAQQPGAGGGQPQQPKPPGAQQ